MHSSTAGVALTGDCTVRASFMGVEQKISNDAKVTFLNAFYRLMTLSA
jgi:hypothetical protein